MARSLGRFLGEIGVVLGSGLSIALIAGASPTTAARISEAFLEGHASAAVDALGFTVEPVDRQLAAFHGMSTNRGVIVTSLADNGPAARAGIGIGDIAIAIDGRPIEGRRGIETLHAHRGPAAIDLLRDGVTRTIAVG